MQHVSLEKIFTEAETPQKATHYKGVCWNKKASKWQAYVYASGKRYYAGYFLNELDAAHAVNAQCDELEIPRRNPNIGDPPSNVIKTTKRIKHARLEAMILSGAVYPQQLVHNPSNLLPIPPTAALNREIDSGSQQLIPDKDALVVPSEFPGRFQCDQCPRSFTSKGGLSRHKNVHWKKQEAERPEPPVARQRRLRFGCTRCEASFESPEDLSWHSNLAHGTREQRVVQRVPPKKRKHPSYELSYSKRRRFDDKKRQGIKRERSVSPFGAKGSAVQVASLFLKANEEILKRGGGLTRQTLGGHNVQPDKTRALSFQSDLQIKKKYYRAKRAMELDFETQDNVACFEETL